GAGDRPGRGFRVLLIVEDQVVGTAAAVHGQGWRQHLQILGRRTEAEGVVTGAGVKRQTLEPAGREQGVEASAVAGNASGVPPPGDGRIRAGLEVESDRRGT